MEDQSIQKQYLKNQFIVILSEEEKKSLQKPKEYSA
tara:strand:- start:343 stop:450 length:108 start_codon:yes stop_codon:yes gene_type:complete